MQERSIQVQVTQFSKNEYNFQISELKDKLESVENASKLNTQFVSEKKLLNTIPLG
jgi:hypothetical protein